MTKEAIPWERIRHCAQREESFSRLAALAPQSSGAEATLLRLLALPSIENFFLQSSEIGREEV